MWKEFWTYASNRFKIFFWVMPVLCLLTEILFWSFVYSRENPELLAVEVFWLMMLYAVWLYLYVIVCFPITDFILGGPRGMDLMRVSGRGKQSLRNFVTADLILSIVLPILLFGSNLAVDALIARGRGVKSVMEGRGLTMLAGEVIATYLVMMVCMNFRHFIKVMVIAASLPVIGLGFLIWLTDSVWKEPWIMIAMAIGGIDGVILLIWQIRRMWKEGFRDGKNQ